jgi:hypothetical protein
MTTQRSQAYARIMRTLSACPQQAALEKEVERLREACATLVFASLPSPRDRHAMTDAIIALADLVAGGHISSELAAALVDDITHCAPHTCRAAER